MKAQVLLMLLALSITGCNAQEKEQTSVPGQVKRGHASPQVKTKVTKKYDEHGNVIGYDSTYVWSYSSRNGTPQEVDADSVMKAFRREFDTRIPSLFSVGNATWDDSTFYKDFTSTDYFMQHWKHHASDMSAMMQRMDSMRNDFLNQHYPSTIQNEKK